MKVDNKLKIIVGVSGGGRSLENLILHAHKQDSNFEISGVISSKSGCRAELIACNEDIPLLSINFNLNNKTLLKDLDAFLKKTKAGLIVLAGFLKPFPILDSFQNKIINIHPALLPKYGGKGMYGMKVHSAVFTNHENISGATIHLVNEEYDKGHIIAQVVIDLNVEDTAEIIAKKVFESECRLLPFIINKIANKELSLNMLVKHRIYRVEELI